MLIANALSASRLEIPTVSQADLQNRVIDILGLFNNDKRAGVAPFSIQNVAEVGLKDFGVYPGEWYGINTASLVFASLNE